MRFLMRFGALVAVFGAAQMATSDALYPVTTVLAHAVAGILADLGWAHVYAAGDRVAFGESTYQVGLECAAIGHATVVAAFCLAWPARWSRRVLGALAGILAVTLANLVRLVACAYTLALAPDAFAFVHDYVWQVGFLAFVLLLARWWAGHAAD